MEPLCSAEDDSPHFAEAIRLASNDLSDILAMPRSQDRQNLVNTNITGSEIMQPASSLGEADKAFSKLAKRVAELIAAEFA